MRRLHHIESLAHVTFAQSEVVMICIHDHRHSVSVQLDMPTCCVPIKGKYTLVLYQSASVARVCETGLMFSRKLSPDTR